MGAMFDVLTCNANNEVYEAGVLPRIIDLKGQFSYATNPTAQYAVILSSPATAAITVTVQCSDSADLSSPETVTSFVIPAGANQGHVPLGVVKKRYFGATVAGDFTGNITAGIVNAVDAPSNMGLAR